jgi:hypothetical protein
MSKRANNQDDGILSWRARALLTCRGRSDAAYGFGGPDVAEVVGTPEDIGAAVTGFLVSLERPNVEAAGAQGSPFSVRVEVEPQKCPGTPGRQPEEHPAEDPVRLWEATAEVGNTHGEFDACYRYGNSQGDEGHLLGTADELGAELARILRGLTRADVEAMKYGTSRFFVRLEIELPRPRDVGNPIRPSRAK